MDHYFLRGRGAGQFPKKKSCTAKTEKKNFCKGSHRKKNWASDSTIIILIFIS